VHSDATHLVRTGVRGVPRQLLARVAAGRVGDPADPGRVGPVVASAEGILGAVNGPRRAEPFAGGGVDGEAPHRTNRLQKVADAELSCGKSSAYHPLPLQLRRGDGARERRRWALGGDLHPRSQRGAAILGGVAGRILHVNSQTAGADVHVPFGGIKGSGFGPHEQGRAAIEFYTELVTVYQDAPLA
jgi:aldehyde dehydrogenase (NAD+)